MHNPIKSLVTGTGTGTGTGKFRSNIRQPKGRNATANNNNASATKNLAVTGLDLQLLLENPDSRPFLNLPTSKSGPHAPGYSIRQPVTPNRETCLAQTACAGCRAPTLPGRKRFGGGGSQLWLVSALPGGQLQCRP